MIGKQLVHYRISALLGKGGVGEVYLAEDARLGREVAIKILPTQVAANPARLQRFERESRAASALSHPNSAQFYDVGEQDGIHFIVMEYVDGPDPT